jgi:hypothetical protein
MKNGRHEALSQMRSPFIRILILVEQTAWRHLILGPAILQGHGVVSGIFNSFVDIVAKEVNYNH